MRRAFSILLFLVLGLDLCQAQSQYLRKRLSETKQQGWQIGIATTSSPENVSVYLDSPGPLYVSWGDGYSDKYTTTGAKTHAYGAAGNYTVTFSGHVHRISWVDALSATPLVVRSIKNRVTGITGITSFELSFYGCNNLKGPLPSGLFRNCPLVTSFSQTFYTCLALDGAIPDDLFTYCPLANTFFYTFYSCKFSGSIPTTLFATSSLATTFQGTFTSCSSLTGSIPATLFTNCPLVTTFSSTFQACTLLSGTIPSSLFSYCPQVTSFGNTFYNNTSLSGVIPDLSSYTNLQSIILPNSHINGYTPSTLSTNLVTFKIVVGDLPASAVNQILADFVTNLASRPGGGVIDLSGAGNAAPTGQGLLDKATIAAYGTPAWTVTTN